MVSSSIYSLDNDIAYKTFLLENLKLKLNIFCIFFIHL